MEFRVPIWKYDFYSLLHLLIGPNLISGSLPEVLGISEPWLIVGDRDGQNLCREKIEAFPRSLPEFIDLLPPVNCPEVQLAMILSENQPSR